MKGAPDIRVRTCNEAPIRSGGAYVLYWMISSRRLCWNFSLDRAIWWAEELRKPLLILEALRIGYPWASDRIHAFVAAGMRDNGRICAESAVTYYPYFEPAEGAGKGLLPALAEEACVVVTDDFPCFFLPRMIESAARQVSVKLEAVDSNGLLPLKAAERCFPTAHGFRSQLQRNLPFHLSNAPVPNPLSSLKLPLLDQVPVGIRDRWPSSSPESLEDYPSLVSSFTGGPFHFLGGRSGGRLNRGGQGA